MRILSRIRKWPVVFVHDLAMVACAWLGAFWLRFNLEAVPAPELRQALLMLAVVVPVQGAAFLYFALFRGVWRFTSFPDMIRVAQSVLVGLVLSLVVIFLLTRMQHIPRSVFPLYGLLLVCLLGAPRFAYRWLRDLRYHGSAARNALIVGAGTAGDLLVRDMLRGVSRTYLPVAFVDDDPVKLGQEVQGVRVMGGCARIPELVEELDVDLVLIAIPSATSAQMRRIVGILSQTRVPFHTLPREEDLRLGQVTVAQLRDVSVADLLGRESVKLDRDAMESGIASKVILVTGGGGSIGTELCRQIARHAPAALIVLESSEYNLYTLEMELRANHPDLALHTLLGNVCDPIMVEHTLSTFRPQMVFHAAAYKHVPILQERVREAVLNNVVGTKTVADLADRYRCGVFVLISTDKAVNPTNVMGATKRVAEMYCQNLNRHTSTRFITVRFGNVLDSAGSVVPLFRRQIQAGGPVTVTHPEITRYFMSIPEACQLILEASVIGKGGEIFLLDMGSPVKIRDLAEQMIRLSGLTPDKDVKIVYTGLRPGEKLYEELFHPMEAPMSTGIDKILLARFREVEWGFLQKAVELLVQGCQRYDEKLLRSQLRLIVPEFRDPLRPYRHVTSPGIRVKADPA